MSRRKIPGLLVDVVVVAVLLGDLTLVLVGMLLLACGRAAEPLGSQASPPAAVQCADPGLVLPCKVIDVHDGDTLTIEVTLTASVRLLECWAEELKAPGGPAARDRAAAARAW